MGETWPWLRDIEEGIVRRAVLWSAANGKPPGTIDLDSLSPEQVDVIRLFRAVQRAIHGLGGVSKASTLEEAKRIASDTLARMKAVGQPPSR